ncbi:MAG TPA: sensor histidine kinase [Ignavibacteria bacterium]|nr:sensor histidine kinase [Ignavibacteria bacterium]HMQ98769.1 sensor histidine kinase [Ignavibacteria bacterium]
MIRDFLKNAGLPAKLFIGVVLVSVVALTDYFTTNEVSFSIFYLIPIAFVTWNTNKYYGLLFALICSVVWFYMDTNGFQEITNFVLNYWSTLVRLGFFTVVTLLISKLRLLRDNQENLIKQRTEELVKEIGEHKKSKAELVQKSSQLRELNKKIESIKEEQNVRIAREIHDELGQSLTAINLEIMWISKKHASDPDIVDRMYNLSGIVENTIGTVRRISSDLRPRLLDQLGILPAIESLLKDFRKRSGIETVLNVPDLPVNLDSTGSITVFRIFQEAITNITRHSKCTRVEVKALLKKDELILSIKDNGTGFNLENKIRQTKSLGLISMQERADVINGSLAIRSAENKGTEIVLSVPLKQKTN